MSLWYVRWWNDVVFEKKVIKLFHLSLPPPLYCPPAAPAAAILSPDTTTITLSPAWNVIVLIKREVRRGKVGIGIYIHKKVRMLKKVKGTFGKFSEPKFFFLITHLARTFLKWFCPCWPHVLFSLQPALLSIVPSRFPIPCNNET